MFWGKKHKDRPHWATETLLMRFSCHSVDFWPKNGQTRLKKDPKLEKRVPDGPDLGKFVVFWVFCLIGPK